MPRVHAMERTIRDDWAFKSAVVEGLVVRLDDDNELAPCAADSEDAVGYTRASTAAGAKCGILLVNAPGTTMLRTAGSFAKRAEVFQAANGKIDDTGTIRVGVSLDESTGADQLVEVLLQHGRISA